MPINDDSGSRVVNNYDLSGSTFGPNTSIAGEGFRQVSSASRLRPKPPRKLLAVGATVLVVVVVAVVAVIRSTGSQRTSEPSPDKLGATIVPTIAVAAIADQQHPILRPGSVAFSRGSLEAGLAAVERYKASPFDTQADIWEKNGAFMIGGATVRVQLDNTGDAPVTLTNAHILQSRVPAPTALAMITPQPQGNGEVAELYSDLDTPDPSPMDNTNRGQRFFDLRRPQIPPHQSIALTLTLYLRHDAAEVRLRFDFVSGGHKFAKSVDNEGAPIRVAAYDCNHYFNFSGQQTAYYQQLFEQTTNPLSIIERVPPFAGPAQGESPGDCPTS